MRNSRTRLWLAALVAALLVVLIGCGGSDNSSNGNTGNNSGGNPGTSNPGNNGGNGEGSSSGNQLLYAGSLDSGVQAFKIDANSGGLTQVSGSPFASGLAPNAIAVDPANRFLYAGISQQPAERGANCTNAKGEIDSYTINADGSLATLEKVPLQTYCISDLLLDPTGKNLYAFTSDLAQANSLVVGFNVDSSTGKLTPMTGSPFAVASNPGRGVFSSDGRFIYAANNAAGNGLVVLARNASGVVSQSRTVPFPSNMYVADLALVSGGKYLVTTTALNSTTNDLRVFNVDQSSGNITLAHTLSGGNFDNSATVLADRTGQYLFVGLYTGGINVFKIVDGNLTFVSNVANAARTLSMAIDTSNRFLYAQNNNNSVSAFTFDVSKGTLTPIAGAPFSSPSQLVSPVVVKK